ncbi:hypothetical protein ACFXJ8_39315 [Nonomuraea sp. NPDC059194]|uniref:hypothetical protein n=1 Tax=Nonomuraea sp. NPDC059194 TaxID=3346764 RepID=UPI0036A05FBA
MTAITHAPARSGALTLSDRDRLALLLADYVALLAHARAAVAAAELGEADPTGYLRDLLAERGQRPAAGASPAQLMACAMPAPRMLGGAA